MPSLSEVRSLNEAAASKFKTRPVLVVFGGTSGIGAGIARAFANHTRGNIHIVILGRNKQAATDVIASFPKTVGGNSETGSLYEFVPVDAFLMRNVGAAANELRTNASGYLHASLTKINFLVLSQGAILINHPKTEEGLDPFLALSLFGRVRAALELAPLLEAATAAGEDGRVMTVMRTSSGGPVDLKDPAMEHMGFMKVQGALYTSEDIFALEFAASHPTLSVTHVYPGFVATNIKNSMPAIMRFGISMGSIFGFGTKPDDCGEWMMGGLVRTEAATGAHFLDPQANPVAASSYANETTRPIVWKAVVDKCGFAAPTGKVVSESNGM